MAAQTWCRIKWKLTQIHQLRGTALQSYIPTATWNCSAVTRFFHSSHHHSKALFSDEKLTQEEKHKEKLARKEAKRLERLEKQRAKKLLQQQAAEPTYDVPTIRGEKKDTSVPLPNVYSPAYVEAAWYDWWNKQGFFRPEYMEKRGGDVVESKPFVICLPPPNVTGTLHLGHALGNAIEDAIVRWHRMQGRAALWNPGCDHAGIATQVVVEKKLWRDQQTTRFDLGREAFVTEVWKWKQEKGDRIYEQMKRMGSSLDWSRECFTLDQKLSRAVTEAFVRLHDEGQIYRSKRLVNWSCTLKSAISDIEVDNLQLNGSTKVTVPGYKKPVCFGRLESFAYPVVDSEEKLIVCTTRLETMLGDVAVAVHPEDTRYRHLHGRSVQHPLYESLQLPIICDEFVDKDFGTGAVKVTPAHDHKDFDVGERHQLPSVDILTDDGCLQNVPEQFMNMKRFDAREKVRKKLDELGLFLSAQDHSMVLPICSRSKDIVEPRLKEQWYLSCDDMAQVAAEVVKSGELKLIPKSYENLWFEWLGNIRDWCISRQLWWGHRIPAYRVRSSKDQTQVLGWVSGRSELEAQFKAEQKYAVSQEEIILDQDEDVLDTWFSSALFPFSIFGWPEQTKDFYKYYPTHLLETASDIMFFWVARMVMLGHKLTGKLPFNEVLFHSILRDAYGRKMSKSLGNIIDPMHVINGISLEELQNELQNSNLDPAEIQKASEGQGKDFPLGIPICGADALRFTLCSYNFHAQVTNVDVSHMRANRSFCNKIWQAFRFVTSSLPPGYEPPAHYQMCGHETATDLWMLSRLSATVQACRQAFQSYNLHHAAGALRHFFWADFCDVYLEYVKPVLQSGDGGRCEAIFRILHLCLDTGLRLLSPFMPYITEELYQRLPQAEGSKAVSICVAAYPQPEQYSWFNHSLEEEMDLVMELVQLLLVVRKDFGLTKQRAQVMVQCSDHGREKLLQKYASTLQTLSRSSQLEVTGVDNTENTGDAYLIEAKDGIKLYVHLKGIIDVESVCHSLTQRIEKLEREIMQLLKQTSGEDGIVEQKIASTRQEVERTSKILDALSNL